jgi:hypothetical protein
MADEKEKKSLDVCSPELNSPKEEKEMFCKVLENYINE